MIWVVGIIAILIGLAMSIWGYNLFRFWLGVTGFILGAFLGFLIGSFIPGSIWAIILAIVLGIIFALLSFFLYRVGAILTGAFLGALLSSLIFGIFNIGPVWWVYLIGAIPGAIIAGLLIRHYIIIGSSFIGGYLVGAGIYSLIVGKNLFSMQENMLFPHNNFPWYIYIIIIAVAIFGIVLQYRRNKGRSIDDMMKRKRAGS